MGHINNLQQTRELVLRCINVKRKLSTLFESSGSRRKHSLVTTNVGFLESKREGYNCILITHFVTNDAGLLLKMRFIAALRLSFTPRSGSERSHLQSPMSSKSSNVTGAT